MSDPELVREILSQLLEGGRRIERRFAPIRAPEELTADDDGLDRLDAICMMLIAIGEGLKNLDKVTEGRLLARHPEIDWRGAKGMRDILSHHYFDLNAEIVFAVCAERLPPLLEALRRMREEEGE